MMMKRLRKTIQWLLLLSLFVSNMPLIYAEEINEAIKQGQAEEAYKKAVPVIDRMADKGIIHKNKAARHKSRLNAQVKALASN